MSIPTRHTLAAYGALGFPYAAAFIALQVVVPTWYAENTALSLSVVGLVMLVARLMDTVTDPVVGWLSDRSRARIGRRKVFVVCAAPFVAVAVWRLFMPSADAGGAYLLFWTVAVYIAGTVALVPMSAWAAELSEEYHERSRITGARVTFGLAGTLVALVVVALTAEVPDDPLGSALTGIVGLFVVSLVVTTLWAWRVVPDSAPDVAPDTGSSSQSWTALKPLFTSKNPFRQLLVGFLLNAVGNAIPASLFLLYVTHVLQREAQVGLLLFVYFVAAALSVPVWVALARRIGKHPAWVLGILLACAFFIITPFISASTAGWFWLVVVVTGFATGADLALPSAMNADVIEWDELENGLRRPGLFFAMWGTATKLSYALAIGIAFPLLEAGGFDAGVDNDAPALLWLAVLYGGPAILFKLAALWVMRRYPITEARHTEIRASLAARGGAADSSR